MILCIGDSLTYGAVGYSYLSYVSNKYKFKNLGINGDSLYGGGKRAQKCLRKRKYRKADVYVIALGTNDILIPFLGSRSGYWNMNCILRNISLRFSKDVKTFSKRCEELVRKIKQTEKRLILIGLPYIQLEGYPLGKIEQYNRCISAIADKYQAEFIDIYAMQKSILKEEHVFDWGRSNGQRIFDGIYMTLFPRRKDRLSKRRKLEVTVDGVHYNSRVAKMLGRELERRLNTEEEQAEKVQS